MNQQTRNTMDRRRFLKGAGLLGLALAGGGALSTLSACTYAPLAAPRSTAAAAPSATAPVALKPTQGAAPTAAADLEIALKAARGQVAILPGAETAVWRYQAEVLAGDPASVVTLPGSYLGPVLRVRQGQRVRVHFTNDLPEPSIVHWHGLLVPDAMDGHPRNAVGPGQSYAYDFQVINRAGTYWFHPHPHTLTGSQAYRGLAGLLLVSDAEEAALGLPQGEYDVPLVIQDRQFDAGNQLVYLAQGGQGMMGGGMMGGMGGMDGGMTQMMGFLGDRILVNGQPDFTLPVATRAYRLRLLNGSNSRIYKLAWRDGSPLTVMATDGGLLEQPLQRPFVMLAPGERIELWADFTGRKPDDEIFLDSQEFVGAEGDELMGAMGGMGGMGGMMTSGAALPNGAAFPVARFRVARQEQGGETLPAQLARIERYQPADAVNAARPRQVAITNRMMAWLLNGRAFEMTGVAADEVGRVGELTMWEFVNQRNPGQMMEQNGMAHPMHIHGTQFQVLERQVLPELKAGFESVRAGYVDEGWKDTVLVMPGERVKVLLKYQLPGLFLYHCHNLEHEDQGMMRNFRVEA
ncbi:MAG: multicopper oxidase domain-containing protein [Chloroflexi bacterium]|nr:multicopper oxidase domain-containing protein [Chloroflexota bacterium]